MIDLPENELALRAQAGDTEAEAALIERFEPFHQLHAQRLPAHLRDDTLQGARLGTMRAIRKFDPTRGAALSSYVHFYATTEARIAARTKPPPEGSEVSTPIPTAPKSAESSTYTGQLAALVRAAVDASTHFDAVDRLIFYRIILPAEEAPTFRAVANEISYTYSRKCSPQAVHDRSIRIRSLLPRVLASLSRE